MNMKKTVMKTIKMILSTSLIAAMNGFAFHSFPAAAVTEKVYNVKDFK
jgi:hypothetical protein